jgi:outer membrane protein assembly factor BamE (lipoprotein component of BamABCDE complex)
MSRVSTLCTVLLVMVLCLQLTACSNLTQENYDKIKMGMSFQEVEKLLGSGPTCDSAMGMKSCTWGTPDRYVKIQFVAEKVALHAAKGLK